MGKENYNYLFNRQHNIKLEKNSPDVYVLIEVNSKKYYIPVSMPRRMPFLDFDMKNLDDGFWDYLDNASAKLSADSISEWVEKNKKAIGTPTRKEDKLLLDLLSKEYVCSKCHLASNPTNNPQKLIQKLRDRGYIIFSKRSILCSDCGKKTTRYTLTPVIKTGCQNYETISKALKKRICSVFNYTDAFSCVSNHSLEAHIPDHKFPEDRWDADTPADNRDDMPEEDIREKFQLISQQANFQKQRACQKCIRTNERGYPYNIKYYYKGSEQWDSQYPPKGPGAEAGCEGCGWYDIEKWRASLNEKISKSEEH